MLTVFWSCKGGVGTTVVTALSALRSAQSTPTIAVGLDGDLAAALGVSTDPTAPGLAEWLAAARDGATAEALARLGVEVAPGLSLVGPGALASTENEAPIAELANSTHNVIVDAGRIDRQTLAHDLAAAASASLFVTRRCYLALCRANQLPLVPTGVIVVSERGRALTVGDIEAVTGVPVVADLAVDASLARIVDAGLLSTRLPRGVLGSLDRVA